MWKFHIVGALKSAPAKPLPRTVPASENKPAHRLELWVAIAISAWAIVLQCLYAAHAGPLWRDEASSVNFSSVPTVAKMWNNFRLDNFPPLFAFVLRGFAGFFHADISFRIFGLGISMFVLAAIWAAGWLISRRPPLLALALFAINPLAIKTDGAIRPYGLGFALLILTVALICAYAREPRMLWFTLGCAAAVLSVQTLYQATFFIGATILGVALDAVLKKQPRVAGMTMLIGVIAAASLVIDLPHLLHDWGTTKWVGQSSFDISKTAVDWHMLGFAFWRALSTQGDLAAFLSCVVGVVVFAIGIRRRAARPFVIAIVFSTVVYLCFLRFSGLHAQSWYWLIVMALGAVWLDAMAAAVSGKMLRQGIVGVALLIVVIGAPTAVAAVKIRATSLDLVAQHLREKASPKDVVITMPWYYGITLGRYYDRQKFTTVPPLGDTTLHRYDLVQKAMETPEPLAGLMRDMEQGLRNGGKVWTIGEIIMPDDNQPLPVLPPYTPGNGYTDSDYLTSWSMQIAVYLAQHATNFDVVQLPNVGPINHLENPKVVAVSGWRQGNP